VENINRTIQGVLEDPKQESRSRYSFFPKGVDFFSQDVVKIFFRERPEMVKWKTSELAGLKGVRVRVTPSKGGSLSELEPAMFRWRKSELAGRKGVR
jgi:hypothetical protein